METGEQDEKQFILDNQLLQYSIGATRYARIPTMVLKCYGKFLILMNRLW